MHDEAKAVLKAQAQAHRVDIQKLQTQKEHLEQQIKSIVHSIAHYENRISKLNNALDNLYALPSQPSI